MRNLALIGCVAMVMSLLGSAAQANILPNSSFEDGIGSAPNGWSFQTTESTHAWNNNSALSHSGDRSVSMTDPSGSSEYDALATDNAYAIDGTKDYLLSAYVKLDAFTGNADMWVSWYGASGWLGNSAVVGSLTGTIGWTEVEGVVTPLAGATGAQICLGYHAAATATGTVTYDDVSFDVVPEPATLTLLALGAGLVAVRSRRNRK